MFRDKFLIFFISSHKEKPDQMDLSFLYQNEKMKAITKTGLYNFEPLKPHFYIVKLGFTGVYIIFLISALNPRQGGSNEYPQSMF